MKNGLVIDADGDKSWYVTASYTELMVLLLNMQMVTSSGTRMTSYTELMIQRYIETQGGRPQLIHPRS